MKRVIYFLNDEFQSTYYYDGLELDNCFKRNNRLNVYNPAKKSGMSVQKLQNLLIIDSSIYTRYNLINMFNSDKEFWKANFTKYSKDNFPEYFI